MTQINLNLNLANWELGKNMDIPRSVFETMTPEEYIDWLMKNALGRKEVYHNLYITGITSSGGCKVHVEIENRHRQYFSSKNSEVRNDKLYNPNYSSWIIDLNDKIDKHSCKYCSSKCKAKTPCSLFISISGGI